MRVALYACGGEHPISEIPLGIGYLMSYCVGHEIEYTQSVTRLIHGKWDFIGLSSPAYGLMEAITVARAIRKKNPNAKIVLGGQGALWDGIERYEEFKYVVRGDGEFSLSLILSGQAKDFGRPLVVMNCPVSDLDILPFPNRGNICRVLPIVTSRGCPYNCAFCSSRAHWGDPRYHSVDYVIGDILTADRKNSGVSEVYIVDDLFMHPDKRFRELHEKWMKLGLNKKFSIAGFTRTNLCTPETLRMLKDMGFPYLRIGIESGSDKVLKAIGKGVTVEDHQRVIDQATEIGLPVRGSFVRGTPDETEEDRRMTAEFIERNKGKLEIMGSYVWKPFPGSRWYNGENPLEIDMRVR